MLCLASQPSTDGGPLCGSIWPGSWPRPTRTPGERHLTVRCPTWRPCQSATRRNTSYNVGMADLIAIADAAREFRLHRVTLYRYVNTGRLTGYRRGIGAGTYVDRTELKRLAEFRPIPRKRTR
jgi:hypothetical protein